MKTLLLAEDDNVMRDMLRNGIYDSNYVIVEATSNERIEKIIQSYSIDLSIIDLNLKDGKSWNSIIDIKNKCCCPIIIISGEDNEHSQIKSIELGVNDYITKPLNINLLKHKISALIASQDQKISQVIDENVRLGNWSIDMNKFQAFDGDGCCAHLTKGEFKILQYLIHNRGTICNRHDLCLLLKRNNYVPTIRSIDIKITRIRAKLLDSGYALIQTAHGVGYFIDNFKER